MDKRCDNEEVALYTQNIHEKGNGNNSFAKKGADKQPVRRAAIFAPHQNSTGENNAKHKWKKVNTLFNTFNSCIINLSVFIRFDRINIANLNNRLS